MQNTILAESDVRAVYATARQCVQNASAAIDWPRSQYRSEPLPMKVGEYNVDGYYLTRAFDDLREGYYGEFVANDSIQGWQRDRSALSPIMESVISDEPIQIGERYYSTALAAAFGEANALIECFVDDGDFDLYQAPHNFETPMIHDRSIQLPLWNALREWPSLQKLTAFLDIEERKAIHAINGYGKRSADDAPEDVPSTLDPEDQKLLEAAFDLDATSREKRKSTLAIAKYIEPHAQDSSHIKRRIRDLVKAEFLESQTGRQGGVWLTKHGLKTVRKR